MGPRLITTNTPPRVSDAYSFANQEREYYQFRPQWPVDFALASLQKLGICYHHDAGKWSGIGCRSRPVVVAIGSGAGSDAGAFLQLGCKVYGIEPNDVLRKISVNAHQPEYGTDFIALKGNAHFFDLPIGETVDLIVCAQSLHTFSADIIRSQNSESLARYVWERILPDDNESRISIWYYNLDPLEEAVRDLHSILRQSIVAYANSKTPLFNAPTFEPVAFQHYISAREMLVSNQQSVDTITLSKEQLMAWLKSYSFYPKSNAAEEGIVRKSIMVWFEKHKSNTGIIKLPYIGFITQGPLRKLPYYPQIQGANHLPPSPISFESRCSNRDNTGTFWPARDNITALAPRRYTI